MRKTRPSSTLLICFILLFILALPLISTGSELIHTIQTASHASEADALNAYESLEQKFDRQKLAYLRIEKIGGYYAIRIGKFQTHADAKELLQTVRQHSGAAAILKAHIKEDRLVRIYQDNGPIDKPADKAEQPSVEKAAAASEGLLSNTVEVKKEALPAAREKLNKLQSSDAAVSAEFIMDKKGFINKEPGSKNNKLSFRVLTFIALLIISSLYLILRVIKSKTRIAKDNFMNGSKKEFAAAPAENKIEHQAAARVEHRAEACVENQAVNENTPAGAQRPPLTIIEAREAVNKTPEMAETHNDLGIAYSNAGIYKNAIAAYKEAVRIKPDYAEAHCNLGVACNTLGMLKEAITAHKDAIKINPGYAEAHNNLGIAYSWSGLYKEAIEAHQLAIELKPEYTEAHYNLGIAYSKAGMFENAIEAYKRVIETDPLLAKAYNNLGIAYSKSDMFKDAIEAHEQAIKLKPHYAEAYYNLGIAYSKSGRVENAIEAYKEAVDINPNFAEAHNSLGVACTKSGRYEDAVEAYKKAIKLKPHYTEARQNLEIVYSKAEI